jgi:transcriptional regulator with GAF, ATPase, and Fis domain
VASAIQNIRLLDSAHVDLEETSLLYRLTRRVSEASSEQDALNAVIENLPQIQHTSALLSVDGENMHITALYDPQTRKMERGLHTIDIPARRMAESLNQGEPIFVADIALPSEYDNIFSFFLRRDCHSAIILPCMQAGKPSKILVIGFKEEHNPSQAMLQPYINLAEVISANLDKFSLLQSLQQRLSELQVLATFSRAASAETNLQDLLKTLHQLVIETMGDDLGFVLALHRADRNLIEFPYAYENQQLLELDPLPVGNGLTSYIIQNRTPLLISKDAEQKAAELGARIIGNRQNPG